MAVSVSETIEVLNILAGQGASVDAPSSASIPKSAFTNGYCAVYAAALIEQHPDWSVVAVGAGECICRDPEDCDQYGSGICMCMVDHFYAKSPEGWLHDVYGQHDPEAVDWGILVDVPDRTFACVLEMWHLYQTDVVEFIGCARELISAHV